MRNTSLQSGQVRWNENDEDYTPSQVVYLDFDGAETSYYNPDLGITVDNITVQDSGLTAEQISTISSALNEQYADRNIQFVTEQPQEGEYSTVYVGDTEAFDSYGNFRGLAETIDKDNKVKNDNAFVLMNSDFTTESIISVISHEVEHIAEGMQHDVSNGTLDDYAITWYNETTRFDELYNDVRRSAPDLGTQSSTFGYSGDTSGSDDYDWICFTAGKSGTLTVSQARSSSHTEVCYDNPYSWNSNVATPYASLSMSVTKGQKYYFVIKNYKLWQTTEYYSWQFSISSSSSSDPDPTPTPTPTGKADLSLASMALSSYSVTPQESVNITFTVQNSGSASASGSYAYIYDGSTRLGRVWVSYLSSGSTSDAYSYTIAAGELSAGTHNIKVVVDANDSVDESNENNNSASHTLTVAAPDLSITSLEASSSSIDSTEPVALTFTVENSGNTASGANFAYIYSGQTMIGLVFVPFLSAEQSTTCSYTIYPGILAAGSNTLKVVVDGNKVVAESDESNNSDTCSVTVKQQPDLQPGKMSRWEDSIKLSVNSTPGKTGISTSSEKFTVADDIRLSWAVKNAGEDISETFTTTLFLDGEEYESWTTDSLQKDQYAYALNYNLGKLSAGLHTARIITDSTGVISESNEYNNDFSKIFAVAAPSTSAAVTDYNGSGRSDMIQFVNGLVYVMYDKGTSYVQTPAIADVTGWNVTETRRDLTGDGLADIQITSDDGAGHTWIATLRNDSKTTDSISLSYQFIGAYDNKLWSYLGSADFNADGKSEVLMVQTADGADGAYRHVIGWVTDETTCLWTGNIWLGSLTDEWAITGTADVDGDGADNVLLRRYDGMIGYWSIAGSNDIVELKDAGNRLLIMTGDFDGDGTEDFLWQSAVDGELSTWTDIDGSMSDTVIGKASNLGSNWCLAGVGDYDNDSVDELLWCDSSTCKLAYGEANQRNFSKLTQLA